MCKIIVLLNKPILTYSFFRHLVAVAVSRMLSYFIFS